MSAESTAALIEHAKDRMIRGVRMNYESIFMRLFKKVQRREFATWLEREDALAVLAFMREAMDFHPPEPEPYDWTDVVRVRRGMSRLDATRHAAALAGLRKWCAS